MVIEPDFMVCNKSFINTWLLSFATCKFVSIITICNRLYKIKNMKETLIEN